MFDCVILADSLFSNGARLTTFKIRFPRSILAEFNTHRMFSRNAASSRAIPVTTMIENIRNDSFVPVFRKNAKGMQGFEDLNETEQENLE